MRLKNWLGFVVFLFLLNLAGSQTVQSAKQEMAPNFSAQGLPAGEFQFDPLHLEKPTLLVFWASWCQSCRYEMPELIDLYNDPKSAVEIVGVNVDRDPQKAVDLIQTAGIPYLNVLDKDAEISKKFKINRTPTLVLVDRTGMIQKRAYRLKDVQKELR